MKERIFGDIQNKFLVDLIEDLSQISRPIHLPPKVDQCELSNHELGSLPK